MEKLELSSVLDGSERLQLELQKPCIPDWLNRKGR